jgi:hypothetical protein
MVRNEPVNRGATTLPIRTLWARQARHGLLPALALMVVAVLLLAPTAAGAKNGTIVKHGPPFHGTLHYGQVVVALGCGASAGFKVPPKFNLTTGLGGVFSNSSVTGCGPPGFPDFGATQGIDGFDSTVFTWTALKPKNITWNFTEKFVVNLSATPMNPAGGPYAWASCDVRTVALLWDLTASAAVDSFTSIDALTTNGSASGYVNQSTVLPWQFSVMPGNFTKGHQYLVEMYFDVLEYTYAPSHSSTSATARVNMATGGHHYKAGFWELS